LETSNSYYLTLYYQRLREKRDNDYPYRGSIELSTTGSMSIKESFICWPYKKIIARLSELMNAVKVDRVFFQRTERDDLQPIELGDRLKHLLQVDPLAAYHSMLYEPVVPTRGGVEVEQSIPGEGGVDTTTSVFREHLHLRMGNGMIEDPETGTWLSMAYGPESGWRIRRNDNRPSKWIPVELLDSSPEGTSFAERLAFARWARVLVKDLLEQNFERYYLPGTWNTSGPWIKHEDLKKRLEDYLAKQEKKTCP